MGDTGTRQITVEQNEYLWRFRDVYNDDMHGKLVIYSANHKGGHLEIYFTFNDHQHHFPQGTTEVYKWTGEKGIMFFQPVIALRIIRHARRELNWHPAPHTAPMLITDGYQLLKNLGYEPVPHPSE
ncbi:MAG: hypothetical protein RLP44_22085 [Aggregatilineales bacterium]